MDWMPSSQPAGSLETTGREGEGAEKREWQRTWWPKQEPKIFMVGLVWYVSVWVVSDWYSIFVSEMAERIVPRMKSNRESIQGTSSYADDAISHKSVKFTTLFSLSSQSF